MMRVGYGKACITPPLGTPCALGLEDELVEVFDDLYVRAVSVQIGDESALIAAADLIGLYPKDVDEFSARMARTTGVPKDRIILHATHTHQTGCSRWEVARLLDPYGLSDGYASPKFRQQVSDGFVAAAKHALASAASYEMAYAESPVSGIASNRRVPVDDKGNVAMRNSRPSAEMREKPEGRIDPLLRMVLFRNLENGRIIGICNYCCHPSSAGGDEGPYATGDFPAAGMDIVEKEFGDIRLLHLTGTCGDINPGKYVTSDSRAPEDRKRDVQLLGGRYADAVRSALSAATGWHRPDGLRLEWAQAELSVRADIPDREECLRLLREEAEAYKKARAEGTVRKTPFHPSIYRHYARLRSRDGRITTRAAAMRLGGVCFTFLPGEIFLRFGDALREGLGGGRLLNSACCLDSGVGYVVPPDCFGRGGYEEGRTWLGPTAYGDLMAAVASALGAVSGRVAGRMPDSRLQAGEE